MAITAFLPGRIYGGPATVAINQARELVARGHNVTIITSDVLSLRPRQHLAVRESVIDGVRVLYFPTWILVPRFPGLISPALKSWVKRNIEQYNVAHIHFARDWIPVTVANGAMAKSVPVAIQPHGMLGRTDGIRKILDRMVIQRILNRADAVLALQEVEAESIGCIARHCRCEILPNGIAPCEKASQWDSGNLEARQVLFLARLHPRKRVTDAIVAVAELKKRGFPIRLRVVGPDEGDLSIAQSLVRDLNLENAVDFVGPVSASHAKEEFLRSSVYVLPSIDEPFPMTVLEALSLGVPTVVTEGIHIRDVLRRNNAASVVPAGPFALANEIRAILESKTRARQLSENGRQLIRDELNIGKVVSRLEAMYQKIITNAGDRAVATVG